MKTLEKTIIEKTLRSHFADLYENGWAAKEMQTITGTNDNGDRFEISSAGFFHGVIVNVFEKGNIDEADGGGAVSIYGWEDAGFGYEEVDDERVPNKEDPDYEKKLNELISGHVEYVFELAGL